MSLATLLSDAGILVETSPDARPEPTFSNVLKKRLEVYYSRQKESNSIQRLEHLTSRDELELLTAKEAILLVGRIQTILSSRPESDLLGTRDLAKLRTLLSLVFRWGTDPLYARVSGSAAVLDAGSGREEDLCLFADIAASSLSLVFPRGLQGPISQTHITSTIIARHLHDLLLALIALGWWPGGLSKKSMHETSYFQSAVIRLAELVPPSQIISALGNILNPTPERPPLPSHMRAACTSLLTKQLLRHDGVQGLFMAVLSEEQTTGSEVPLDKLERVARILNSVPSTMTPMEYYQLIFPRVLQVLIDSSHLGHKRAAAFTVYRALVQKKATRTSIQASSTVLSLLQGPFLESPSLTQPLSPSSPRRHLQTLTTLLLNAEPSPTFITKLLSSIVAPLYRLSYDLSRIKTANPQLRESVFSLLKSWAKIVEEDEGASVLWALSENDDNYEWKFDAEGNIWKAPGKREQEKRALLMPEDAKIVEDDLENHDLNIFDFYPDPIHFVDTLKVFDRADIASTLFVKFLEGYQEMKVRRHQDHMKVLHKLQIITQFQKSFTEGATSNILSKPSKLLSFIRHVLATPAATGNEDAAPAEDGDSDDEQDSAGMDDELVETAISLLLSVLEANEMISASTHPILDEIFSLLHPLTSKGSPTLRAIAREARLVMTARLSSTSGSGSQRQRKDRTGIDEVQEAYQRALKLLQDPVLPVRAYGLLVLRELLGARYSAQDQLQTVEALAPSILSIFLQSVQDEDSYIFLNATQGLAALVDRFGREILQSLMREFTEQLGGHRIGNLTKSDIDVLTRIGEALGMVIKRCGTALGLYVDLLIPPLSAVIRNTHVPTVLRMSSISLLGDCVDTYSLAVLPYTEDLCTGFIDLLQIESVPTKSTLVKSEREEKKVDDDGGLAPSLYSNPASKDSRLPPLRRAALHFLSLLIRSSTQFVCDDRNSQTTLAPFPPSAFRRANVVLDYVSSVDEDRIVRVMATEAKENLEQLQSSMLGLSELI